MARLEGSLGGRLGSEEEGKGEGVELTPAITIRTLESVKDCVRSEGEEGE